MPTIRCNITEYVYIYIYNNDDDDDDDWVGPIIFLVLVNKQLITHIIFEIILRNIAIYKVYIDISDRSY